ncbi:MAG: hypothetical protein ABSA45_11180 [Verrucomicrobiota bacterium]
MIFTAGAGRFVLHQAELPGVLCMRQTSTGLSDCAFVATNPLTGNVLDVTHTMASDAHFRRALWLPRAGTTVEV